MTKKLVKVNKETVDFEYLTIDQAIEYLQRLKSDHSGDAEIVKDSYPYEDKEYLFLRVEEIETDHQYAVRLKNEAAHKVWQDAHDKKEFERLQKKFS